LIISGDSLYDVELPSCPSEVVKYYLCSSVLVFGDRSGLIYCIDFESTINVNDESFPPKDRRHLKQSIKTVNLLIDKVYNTKKPVTALDVGENNGCIISGDSNAEIDVIFVEVKNKTHKRRSISALKPKSVVRISMNQFVKAVGNASVDSLSTTRVNGIDYLLVNHRSEHSILLFSQDGMKKFQLLKNFRVPSNRGKCPAAINSCERKKIAISGTDMGDLVLAEEDKETTILNLNESSINSLDWAGNFRQFLASDVSSLISFWYNDETEN
jgi:hypothetical protein